MTERILVVAHNHPDLHPGGTEIFAHDLFRAFGRVNGMSTLFLAGTNQVHRPARPGTAFQAVGRGDNEVVMWSGHFETFYLSQVDLYGVVPDLTRLLEEFQPDVVHIHHVLLLGVEFIALVRRVLPNARIVMTLHDYYSICAHNGLMLTPRTHDLCYQATPDRCRSCFPEIAAESFVIRTRYLQTLLAGVDLFITPSQFAADRYAAWGLPPSRIQVVANGRPRTASAPHRLSKDGRRAVLGYFGNLSPWKGTPVLLRAIRQLAASGVDVELRLHGGAPFQSDAFVAEIQSLLDELGGRVVELGAYRAEDLPGLMAAVDWVVVPSIWWENAPLVIQEAFLHRRPVITSAIGGMAEMVRDGVDGLHAPADDPAGLAAVLARAVGDPQLWQTLVDGITPPPSIDAVASRHLALFNQLELARAA